MKRNHGYVSATPLFLQKKGRTASRQDGLLGTPVEGLTDKPIDTPDSEDRPQRAIPDTTQRRLEGFCLSTPLSLSQAAQQETPTLGSKDQPEQHEEVQPQQQQQQHHQQHVQSSQKQQQHLAPAGQGRHRLANISNLPPSPARTAAGPESPAAPDSSFGVQAMATGGTTGRAKRKHHIFFQPGLMSPPHNHNFLVPSSGSRSAPSSAAAAAAAAAVAAPASGAAAAAAAAMRTPYPSHLVGAGFGSGTPGSSGGCGTDDDDGFVLFTSQNYVRQSQPVISPNFGTSQAGEELGEPTTTPSQDSREPRPSLSNGTSLATTTVSTSFDQLQTLASTAAGAAACTSSRQQQDEQDQQQEWQHSDVSGAVGVASSAAAAAAAAAAGGSITPGDGVGLLLPVVPVGDLEETTTPELEQIGMASQEAGSQQLLGGAAGSSSRGVLGGVPGSRGGTGGGGGGVRGRGPGVVCEEVTTKQLLFPIFRPKSERKCVILVRHGESTYNKQDAHGRSWADPHIFDAPLTQRGRQQAIAAQDKVQEMLRKHSHMGSTLWLSSPLTRALETMTLAAPEVEAYAGPRGGRAGGQQHEQRVMVLSLIAEHCATSGDVGRPTSQLLSHFPGLSTPLGELEEHWWFNPSPQDSPNCAVTRVFNKPESLDNMRRRVSEFSRWLRNRPEQVVVAFGHSTFWKYFANSTKRMRNCEVVQMWW